MQTILVATDFSAAAAKAFKYAVKLAEGFDAKVILLNVFASSIQSGDADWNDELKENADGQLQQQVELINIPATVEVQTRSEEGETIEVILSVAEHEKVSWIVAGIERNNTNSPQLIGRTAADLRRRTTIPLILVPEEALTEIPKTIAFASNFDDRTDLHTLDPVNELGKKFHSELFVVRVIKKGMNDVFEMLDRPTVLQSYLKELHPAFEFPIDENVTHAINEFIEEHHIDMIVMIKPHENFIERTFTRSDTKQMMLKTKVPLIILAEKVDEFATAF